MPPLLTNIKLDGGSVAHGEITWEVTQGAGGAVNCCGEQLFAVPPPWATAAALLVLHQPGLPTVSWLQPLGSKHLGEGSGLNPGALSSRDPRRCFVSPGREDGQFKKPGCYIL